jgi:hypothetical protein
MINPVGDINGDPSATASGGSWGSWWTVYEIIPKDTEIQIEMVLYQERKDRRELKKTSQNQVGFRVCRNK